MPVRNGIIKAVKLSQLPGHACGCVDLGSPQVLNIAAALGAEG